MSTRNISRFPSFPGPLYQNEVKCPAFDWKWFVILMQIKLYFHKKGCPDSTWPHLESEVFVTSRKWLIHVIHDSVLG